MSKTVASAMLMAGEELATALEKLNFTSPVAVTYNTFAFAWEGYRAYLEKFVSGNRRILFLGMNPGPWGMVQTGIPFGEVSIVRDWMKLNPDIHQPEPVHPKRPVKGMQCERSEVSGRRLWGLFVERFKKPQNFFNDHIVLNYCPLAFMEKTGRNLTPDKLPAPETRSLQVVCDDHLRTVVAALRPDWVIGVGVYAEKRAREALDSKGLRFGRILHPSPANPHANAGWAERATTQMQELGAW